MDANIDFSNDLFEQFTMDLSSFSLPTEPDNLIQEQNTLENPLIEDTMYNQDMMDISGADILATSDLSSQQHPLEDSLPVGDISFVSQNMLNTPLPTPDYCTPLIHPHNNDLEEFLTPLVSPAITPDFADMYQFLDSNNQEQYFTPLSSPALLPNSDGFSYFSSRHPLQFGSTSNHVTKTTSPDTVKEISNTSTSKDNPANESKMNNNSPPSDDLITGIQDPVILAQQLAQIEAKQQILRDQMKMSPLMSPTYRKSPLGLYGNTPPSPLPFNSPKKRSTSLRQQIALASPKLQSTQQQQKVIAPLLPSRTPATPASLMKIGHQTTDKVVVDVMPSLPPAAMEPSSVKKRKLAPLSPAQSPRTLRPLISPFLQPNNNNSTEPLSPSVEIRRSAHKVAEQRRRDTLKQSFDSLRKEIVGVLIQDSGQPTEVVKEEKEKEVKLMSKVLLLQHSYEYIVRLKTDSQIKDEKLSKMQEELERLKEMAAAQDQART